MFNNMASKYHIPIRTYIKSILLKQVKRIRKFMRLMVITAFTKAYRFPHEFIESLMGARSVIGVMEKIMGGQFRLDNHSDNAHEEAPAGQC
jgi:hypothetical protein